jgi:hypothetical protein
MLGRGICSCFFLAISYIEACCAAPQRKINRERMAKLCTKPRQLWTKNRPPDVGISLLSVPLHNRTDEIEPIAGDRTAAPIKKKKFG